MVKKIGILTSGGDSPGMNMAIRAAARTALSKNIEVFVIHEGFKGLVENKIFKAKHSTFSNLVNKGGTFIGSSRLPEFVDIEVRKKAHENLKKNGIDSLIIIGGNGSYMGGLKLIEEGFNCIGLPGTIDNDVPLTDYTIGFDTAFNTIVRSVDQVSDTTFSHKSCCIVEVMGRNCGDLALFSALSSSADVVSFSEKPLTEDQIIENLVIEKKEGKDNFIVIVSEKLYNIEELAKKIESKLNFPVRSLSLGHLQRGGSPTAFDRMLSARLGYKAIELLLEGKKGICLGIEKNEITHHSFVDVINAKLKDKKGLLDIFNAIK